MKPADGNLESQFPGRPDIAVFLAVTKVAQKPLYGALLGVRRIQLELLVERELAHVDARVPGELRQGADDVGVLLGLLELGLCLLHGPADDRVDSGEELDRCRVAALGLRDLARGFDLVGRLAGNEAADVDCLGVLGGEGLSDFGSAGLEDYSDTQCSVFVKFG